MQQPTQLAQAQAADLETRLREYETLDARYRQLEARRKDAIAYICQTLVGCGENNDEFTDGRRKAPAFQPGDISAG